MTRGKYKRTAAIKAKNRVETLIRDAAQAMRSLDSRVGKWLRQNERNKYNEIVEKVDNENAPIERQEH